MYLPMRDASVADLLSNAAGAAAGGAVAVAFARSSSAKHAIAAARERWFLHGHRRRPRSRAARNLACGSGQSRHPAVRHDVRPDAACRAQPVAPPDVAATLVRRRAQRIPAPRRRAVSCAAPARAALRRGRCAAARRRGGARQGHCRGGAAEARRLGKLARARRSRLAWPPARCCFRWRSGFRGRRRSRSRRSRCSRRCLPTLFAPDLVYARAPIGLFNGPYGHLLNFNGLTHTVLLLWPAVASVFLLALAGRPGWGEPA